MIYSLELDLYKDGMNIDMIDCVNIPVAAASGYYKRKNYFYYIMLVAMNNNWFHVIPNYKLNFLQRINSALNFIGIVMKPHKAENAEAVLKQIQESLKKKIPVALYIKYNAAYYNNFYKDETFTGKHIILIDKWNDQTGIYTIRDSAYLRESNVWAVESECLFPICFPEEQLMQLWRDSFCEDDENTQYVYTIEQYEKKEVSCITILEDLTSRDYRNNQFSHFIRNYRKRADMYWNFDKRDFVGNIQAIMKILEDWGKEEEIDLPAWHDLMNQKDEYMNTRELIFNKLYKFHLRNKELSENSICELIEKNEKNDKVFFESIKRFCDEYKTKRSEVTAFDIDIAKVFNNEAIAYRADYNCSADISGTGVFFYFDQLQNLEDGKAWITPKTADGQFDNISCSGQEICYQNSIYHKLVLLACSEYGDYTEKIKFYKDNHLAFEKEVSFSDFFANPKYNEKKCYIGDAYFKEENETLRKLEFTSKIFKYEIFLPQKESNKIILPLRRNIHIFGMYFE